MFIQKRYKDEEIARDAKLCKVMMALLLIGLVAGTIIAVLTGNF